MVKSGGENPNFELPPEPSGYEAQRQKAMENRPDEEGLGGKAGPKQDSKSTPVPQAPPTISVPVVQADDSAAAAPALTNDLPADDVDLIEKQWVERAKAIVRHTQNDPYAQKKEISKAGADYIKKRFNKTIPTDDTVRK